VATLVCGAQVCGAGEITYVGMHMEGNAVMTPQDLGMRAAATE
jgi:hypothetical protein